MGRRRLAALDGDPDPVVGEGHAPRCLPDRDRRRDPIRLGIDPADGPVQAVRHPHRARPRGHPGRVPPHGDHRRHRSVLGIDTRDGVALAAGDPDGVLAHRQRDRGLAHLRRPGDRVGRSGIDASERPVVLVDDPHRAGPGRQSDGVVAHRHVVDHLERLRVDPGQSPVSATHPDRALADGHRVCDRRSEDVQLRGAHSHCAVARLEIGVQPHEVLAPRVADPHPSGADREARDAGVRRPRRHDRPALGVDLRHRVVAAVGNPHVPPIDVHLGRIDARGHRRLDLVRAGVDHRERVRLGEVRVGLAAQADPGRHGRREQQQPAGHHERRAPASSDRGEPSRRGRAIELRVLAQDRALESLQLGPRLEAELVREPPAALAIGLERIRLPSGAVEREHQLPPHALARGVLVDQRFELGHQRRVTAQGQLGIDAVLERGQPEILEPACLGTGERFVGDVGQGLTSPESEGLLQPLRGAAGVAGGEPLPPVSGQALESIGVDAVGLGDQRVSVSARRERLRAEDLAEPRDVDLHGLGGGRGRALPPEGVDDPVHGDRLTAVDQEVREDRALARTSQPDWLIPLENLQRAEDPELDRPTGSDARAYHRFSHVCRFATA